jgi:hypothetical protein
MFDQDIMLENNININPRERKKKQISLKNFIEFDKNKLYLLMNN